MRIRAQIPLPTAIQAKWNEAGANPGTVVDLGDIVVCDLCMTDYRHKSASGGLIFESKAVGPCCEERFRKGIVQHGETNKIRAVCPAGMSFQQFVLDFRRDSGSGNTIKVITGQTALAAIKSGTLDAHREVSTADAWWRRPMLWVEQTKLLDTTHTYGCACDQCLSWWALMGPDGGAPGDYGPFTKEQVNARQREIAVEVTP